MKKIYGLTLMLSIFSSSLFAQLKVDSYGRVGIGSFYTSNSLLAVGDGYAGNGDYTVTIAPPFGKQGVYTE